MRKPNTKVDRPTTLPTMADVAYAAGFFDGEGCVYLQWVANRIKWRVTISNTCKPALDRLVPLYGGRVYLAHGKHRTEKRLYSWVVERQLAVDFLRQILAYTEVRRQQATSALMCALFAPKPFGQLTPLGREMQDLMWRDVRWLNTKGPVLGKAPVLMFHEDRYVFGYKHLTEDHLRWALEAIAPFQRKRAA